MNVWIEEVVRTLKGILLLFTFSQCNRWANV